MRLYGEIEDNDERHILPFQAFYLIEIFSKFAIAIFQEHNNDEMALFDFYCFHTIFAKKRNELYYNEYLLPHLIFEQAIN